LLKSTKMKTKVIIDSTADIDRVVIDSLDIGVVPIYIRFGNRVYRDGIDITKEQFYEELKQCKDHPATSQPPPEDFARAYKQSAEKAEGIVSIHVSSKISGTFNSASMAKKMLAPLIPVEVIDSKFNSAGLGLVAKAAATLARTGASLEEVVAETNKVINQIHMFGIFETMKYLARSGRVNKTIASVADILNVMPLLTFKNGEITRAGLVRTLSKGMDRIHEFVKLHTPIKELTIVHSIIPEQAQELKNRLARLVNEDSISITELGAALGVHGGPGVLVVGFRTADQG
jgi:DegV family protein with EDD domain